ncbi:MSMEG_0567/sll0787 family protein [Nocardia shimofusensis]|uniref:MSMEG_0567/sll0787 family protein n=1 Tax=Nocardia shimofusensis TaxID=228596 RepID=UPI001FDED911|nr:MSMEG_0567/sll0787 family protein [Nocardia shimofusensis]
MRESEMRESEMTGGVSRSAGTQAGATATGGASTTTGWAGYTASGPDSPGRCVLAGSRRHDDPGFLIRPADGPLLVAYRALRREIFVREQGLFAGSDADDIDDDPRCHVLVALAPDGTLLGGVRLAPATSADIGWWTGSRLVVDPRSRAKGLGPALIRAACALAENQQVLRFEATVRARYESMFTEIGWIRLGDREIAGAPHVWMRWPIDRIERQAQAAKAMLAQALTPLRAQPMGLGGRGFRGDDGAPVPGTDLIAACDAILPSMVERDPEWAGWCSVLVNLNDLSAMGAEPVGMLDAVGAPNHSILTRVLRGLSRAAEAWQVPVLGGHTQLGVPAALSVTALGRTETPVRGGGGRVGDEIRLTADLGGDWRPGYSGRQWDSSSRRTGEELRALGRFVARTAPTAAKDVSMAGFAGTAGMLAEAAGVGAELDIARIPRPAGASVAEWLTCFPGFAMITADRAGAPIAPAGPAESAVCGVLTSAPGVRLRWPDGTTTTAVHGTVTGLGES